MFKQQLPKVVSIISSDTTVQGTITVQAGTIRVDGEIEGAKINAPGIIVGETGKVKADAKGDEVIIAGYVEGSIEATQRIDIMPTGTVHGMISAPSISIAEGSVFEGTCSMRKKKAESEQQSEEQQEKQKKKTAQEPVPETST